MMQMHTTAAVCSQTLCSLFCTAEVKHPSKFKNQPDKVGVTFMRSSPPWLCSSTIICFQWGRVFKAYRKRRNFGNFDSSRSTTGALGKCVSTVSRTLQQPQIARQISLRPRWLAVSPRPAFKTPEALNYEAGLGVSEGTLGLTLKSNLQQTGPCWLLVGCWQHQQLTRRTRLGWLPELTP